MISDQFELSLQGQYLAEKAHSTVSHPRPNMVPLRKQLKDAREKRNLTIQQVAALTNIKTEHIRALEVGNYAFFSAPIYIRGFARSIAIALKMDLLSVMGQLDI